MKMLIHIAPTVVRMRIDERAIARISFFSARWVSRYKKATLEGLGDVWVAGQGIADKFSHSPTGYRYPFFPLFPNFRS